LEDAECSNKDAAVLNKVETRKKNQATCRLTPPNNFQAFPAFSKITFPATVASTGPSGPPCGDDLSRSDKAHQGRTDTQSKRSDAENARQIKMSAHFQRVLLPF